MKQLTDISREGAMNKRLGLIERMRNAYAAWNDSCDGVPEDGGVALEAADRIAELEAERNRLRVVRCPDGMTHRWNGDEKRCEHCVNYRWRLNGLWLDIKQRCNLNRPLIPCEFYEREGVMTMSEWVKVSERLPTREDADEYEQLWTVTVDGIAAPEVQLDDYTDAKWATHWMPKPRQQPPKPPEEE